MERDDVELTAYDPQLVVPNVTMKGLHDGTFHLCLDEYPLWKNTFCFNDHEALKRIQACVMNTGAMNYTWGSFMDVFIPGSPVLALLVNREAQNFATINRWQLRLLHVLFETIVAEKMKRVQIATETGTQWQESDTLESVRTRYKMLNEWMKESVLRLGVFWQKSAASILSLPIVASITANGTFPVSDPGNISHMELFYKGTEGANAPTTYSENEIVALIAEWGSLSYKYSVLRCHVIERAITQFLVPGDGDHIFMTPGISEEECRAYVKLFPREKRAKYKLLISESMWNNLSHLSQEYKERGFAPKSTIFPPTEHETYRQMALKCIRIGLLEKLRAEASKTQPSAMSF